MTRSKDGRSLQVAVVYRADSDNPDREPRHAARLRSVLDALERLGVAGHAVVYLEEAAEETLHGLLNVDAALVWVNPLEKGRDRVSLDHLLRSAAAEGVMVSAHPDVIDRMATKDVLYTTRELGWGGDVRRYTSLATLENGLMKVWPPARRVC